MYILRKGFTTILAILLLTVIGACSSSNEASDATAQGVKEISIGQINWAENIAVTNMWKVILEERGYDVSLHVLNMGTTMKALESGELDASLEIWLPVQDANYRKIW